MRVSVNQALPHQRKTTQLTTLRPHRPHFWFRRTHNRMLWEPSNSNFSPLSPKLTYSSPVSLYQKCIIKAFKNSPNQTQKLPKNMHQWAKKNYPPISASLFELCKNSVFCSIYPIFLTFDFFAAISSSRLGEQSAKKISVKNLVNTCFIASILCNVRKIMAHPSLFVKFSKK